MLKRFAKWLIKRRLGKPTVKQAGLVDQVRRRVAALPPLPAVPSDSAALAEWTQNRRRLRELVGRDDPRRFLQWDVVRETMFVGNARLIPTELACLRASKDWRRWRRVLREDVAGLPDRCRFYLPSSGNLIHHAYSLCRFEQAVGRPIAQFQSILEFGGGYGSFCRLAHRLGFKGQYVIFDLPEFSALQEYFLESVGVPLSIKAGQPGVRCISELKDLKEYTEGPDDWLFIALWSLSEAPLALRREVLGDGSSFSAYLISYQDEFGEVNNKDFFADMMQQRKQIKWFSEPASLSSRDHYLFGIRQNLATPTLERPNTIEIKVQ